MGSDAAPWSPPRPPSATPAPPADRAPADGPARLLRETSSRRTHFHGVGLSDAQHAKTRCGASERCHGPLSNRLTAAHLKPKAKCLIRCSTFALSSSLEESNVGQIQSSTVPHEDIVQCLSRPTESSTETHDRVDNGVAWMSTVPPRLESAAGFTQHSRSGGPSTAEFASKTPVPRLRAPAVRNRWQALRLLASLCDSAHGGEAASSSVERGSS